MLRCPTVGDCPASTLKHHQRELLLLQPIAEVLVQVTALPLLSSTCKGSCSLLQPVAEGVMYKQYAAHLDVRECSREKVDVLLGWDG